MLQTNDVLNPPDPPEIDDYALERIHYRSSRLARQFNLTETEQEDYAQDMVVELLSALSNFDQKQSARNTFIERILDKFVKNAIRKELHRRRRGFNSAAPLDHLSEKCVPVTNDPRSGQMSEVEQMDMKMDVQTILSQMPAPLRRLCGLIQDHSITQISKKLNLHRTSIYRQIEEIREHFVRGGYDFSDFRATDWL